MKRLSLAIALILLSSNALLAAEPRIKSGTPIKESEIAGEDAGTVTTYKSSSAGSFITCRGRCPNSGEHFWKCESDPDGFRVHCSLFCGPPVEKRCLYD